jgi:hypothetical protein
VSEWFRSYDYGFVHRGVMLWWRILGDGRLHIEREFVHRYMSIADICLHVRRITRELDITRVRYTVADKYSMAGRHSDESGETRAELFGRHGVLVTPANHDRVQGFTRVRELLALRPDHRPWLTMDPSCAYLIKAISAAISDKTNPEDVAEFEEDHPLSALRYGAMSRAAPRLRGRRDPKPHTAGALLRDVQTALDRPGRLTFR